jgi:glycosyltransferase involved in cell wall biosynthesis
MSAGRVIYVHRTRGKGVEGVHIDSICAGLRTRGYDITVVSPHTVAQGPASAEPQQPTANQAPGLLQRLFGWLSGYAPELLFELAEMAYNFIAARQIRAALAGGKTSFIYERYAVFAWSASKLAHAAGIPHVIEINYTARSKLVRRRSFLLKPLAVACDRRIFARAHLLVAVSTQLRDELIRDYGIAPERIIVTPNAADPARFDPQTTPISAVGMQSLEDLEVIGFVGTFTPWHGLNLLLDAFAIVARHRPRAALLLVGDGPERERIFERAAKQRVSERVVFTGSVEHAQLSGYVARFDVAVLPDTNDYGSPMKMYEYLAMGKAVVAPDYGPVLDTLRHLDNGLVFGQRDVCSLADRIIAALADRDLAQRLGAAARATIVSERNWLNNVDLVLRAVAARGAVRSGEVSTRHA